MSQNYNFKSLQIADNSEKQKEETNTEELKVFEVGNTKTINFIMLDGTQQNFHYSHYITSWLGKENDETVIKIFFATHLVTIRGVCLGKVYKELSEFKLKSIIENDERYYNETNKNKGFIKKIEILHRKKNNN
jgi:hypothetical protein